MYIEWSRIVIFAFLPVLFILSSHWKPETSSLQSRLPSAVSFSHFLFLFLLHFSILVFFLSTPNDLEGRIKLKTIQDRRSISTAAEKSHNEIPVWFALRLETFSPLQGIFLKEISVSLRLDLLDLCVWLHIFFSGEQEGSWNFFVWVVQINAKNVPQKIELRNSLSLMFQYGLSLVCKEIVVLTTLLQLVLLIYWLRIQEKTSFC